MEINVDINDLYLLKLFRVTAGKTAGNIALPWHMAEPETFKTQVMGSFTRFLSQTSGEAYV